jgi:4-amino-4-deoxy-L-arabinose transferase-like glycosyltransferase
VFHKERPIRLIEGRLSWALLLILLIAATVRLWGINWQMPWLLHPDEDKYASAALDMLRTGDLNPHYFKNPALLTYWLAAQFWVAGAAATLLGWLRAPADLGSPGDQSGLHLLARLNVALLGTATVGATYVLGRLTLGKLPALLGAAFLALCFLHVRDSHYGVNDVPSTFLLVGSTLFAVRLARRPTLRDYLLAGALGGLATATKYSAGLFVVTLLVAHLLAWRRESLGAPALRLLAAAGLLSGAAYLAAAPFTLLDWGAFVEEFKRQYGKGEAP